jgi:hypothetical protein
MKIAVWCGRCSEACLMRSRVALTLMLGLLGGCALYVDDEGRPDTEHPSDPGSDPAPLPAEPTTPRQLLELWSGCMSLESFKSANMAPAWSSISTGASTCASCHSSASGIAMYPVSPDPELFFRTISSHTFAMLEFFSVDLPYLRMIVHPSPFKSVSGGLDPHREHPRFSVEGAPMTALRTFYDATRARQVAGTCDPSRLVD